MYLILWRSVIILSTDVSRTNSDNNLSRCAGKWRCVWIARFLRDVSVVVCALCGKLTSCCLVTAAAYVEVFQGCNLAHKLYLRRNSSPQAKIFCGASVVLLEQDTSIHLKTSRKNPLFSKAHWLHKFKCTNFPPGSPLFLLNTRWNFCARPFPFHPHGCGHHQDSEMFGTIHSFTCFCVSHLYWLWD